MKQSCPEKRIEPGHNKTTVADTVQVLEESCCSRQLLDFISDPQKPSHAAFLSPSAPLPLCSASFTPSGKGTPTNAH